MLADPDPYQITGGLGPVWLTHHPDGVWVDGPAGLEPHTWTATAKMNGEQSLQWTVDCVRSAVRLAQYSTGYAA